MGGSVGRGGEWGLWEGGVMLPAPCYLSPCPARAVFPTTTPTATIVWPTRRVGSTRTRCSTAGAYRWVRARERFQNVVRHIPKPYIKLQTHDRFEFDHNHFLTFANFVLIFFLRNSPFLLNAQIECMRKLETHLLNP